MNEKAWYFSLGNGTLRTETFIRQRKFMIAIIKLPQIELYDVNKFQNVILSFSCWERWKRNQRKVFSKITILTKTPLQVSLFFGSEYGGILNSLRYVISHQVIFATNLFQKKIFQSSHPQSRYKDAWVNWRNMSKVLI